MEPVKKGTGEMTLRGEIKGVEVKVLCDSGSQLNILHRKVLDRIGNYPTLQKSRFGAIVTVSLGEELIQGMIKLPLKLENFNEDVTFHVLRESSFDVIIGRQFLRNFVDFIDIRNSKLIFLNEAVATLNAVSVTPLRTASAKLEKTVRFRPGAEKLISIYPSNDILAEGLLYDVNAKMRKRGFEAATQLVSGYDGVMKVVIKNNTTTSTNLLAGSNVGVLNVQRPATVCVCVNLGRE